MLALEIDKDMVGQVARQDDELPIAMLLDSSPGATGQAQTIVLLAEPSLDGPG